MIVADEVKLALVTAACLIVNAVVFKNAIHLQPSFITLYSPLWVFIVYLIIRTTSKTKYEYTLYWGLVIGLVTLFTILIYAI